MKYIFFCFYNSQYLDGKNGTNSSALMNAITMMFVGSVSWLAIAEEIYYFFVLNQNIPSSIPYAEIITLITLIYLHYYFFIKDRKYDLIYSQYGASALNRRKNIIAIAYAYLFTPIIASMLIAMRWHKIV